MPRYFFNVKDGQDLPDHDGTVLADADAARVMAVFASGEMIRAHAERFWQDGDWQMHVTDEQGASVCDLQLSGTRTAPKGSAPKRGRSASPGRLSQGLRRP